MPEHYSTSSISSAASMSLSAITASVSIAIKATSIFITKLGVLATEKEITKQYRLNYLETKERCDTIKLKLETELECFKELYQLKTKKVSIVVEKLDNLLMQITELENTSFDLMEKCPESPLIPDLINSINTIHACSNLLIQNKMMIEFSPLNMNRGKI